MKKLSFLFAVLFLLSACGLTKDDLGMRHSTPDETKVTKREALVIPPDYGVRPEKNVQ